MNNRRSFQEIPNLRLHSDSEEQHSLRPYFNDRHWVRQEKEMTTSIQRLLGWRFFSRREEVIGTLDIIKWWETRRIAFNIIVGICGIITLAVLLAIAAIASSEFNEPLGLPDPPIIAVFAVIAYAVGANICYTGGWVIELIVKKIWGERSGAFWQIAFLLGMLFSIILTLSPSLIFTGFLIIRYFLR